MWESNNSFSKYEAIAAKNVHIVYIYIHSVLDILRIIAQKTFKIIYIPEKRKFVESSFVSYTNLMLKYLM